MPEVTRQHMLTVLARDGMGWEEARETDEEGFPITNSKREVFVAYESHVFVSPLCAPDYTWDPFTDWRAAGEFLEAMRGKPLGVWNHFTRSLFATFGWGGLDEVLRHVGPADIARAAFEALEWGGEGGQVTICCGCEAIIERVRILTGIRYSSARDAVERLEEDRDCLVIDKARAQEEVSRLTTHLKHAETQLRLRGGDQ